MALLWQCGQHIAGAAGFDVVVKVLLSNGARDIANRYVCARCRVVVVAVAFELRIVSTPCRGREQAAVCTCRCDQGWEECFGRRRDTRCSSRAGAGVQWPQVTTLPFAAFAVGVAAAVSSHVE